MGALKRHRHYFDFPTQRRVWRSWKGARVSCWNSHRATIPQLNTGVIPLQKSIGVICELITKWNLLSAQRGAHRSVEPAAPVCLYIVCLHLFIPSSDGIYGTRLSRQVEWVSQWDSESERRQRVGQRAHLQMCHTTVLYSYEHTTGF